MSDITRRSFLGFLAPLAMLPVVGPHMLLSERPTSLGWVPGLDDGWKFRKYLTVRLVDGEWRFEDVVDVEPPNGAFLVDRDYLVLAKGY